MGKIYAKIFTNRVEGEKVEKIAKGQFLHTVLDSCGSWEVYNIKIKPFFSFKDQRWERYHELIILASYNNFCFLTYLII